MFDYTSLGFSLVLWNDPYTGERFDSLGLNERQIAAVNYLKRKGSISNQEYQKLNNAKKATATRDLRAMVRRGILSKEETTGPGVRYSLTYAETDSKRLRQIAIGSMGSYWDHNWIIALVLNIFRQILCFRYVKYPFSHNL